MYHRRRLRRWRVCARLAGAGGPRVRRRLRPMHRRCLRCGSHVRACAGAGRGVPQGGVSQHLHAAVEGVPADVSRRRSGAPGLPGSLRAAEHLHGAGRAHPNACLCRERVQRRPARHGLRPRAEAPHPARELRPGRGQGVQADARARSSVPRLWRIPHGRRGPGRRPLPAPLPAPGGAAGWFRGGLRGDEPVLGISSPHRRAVARGWHLLRARRRERTPAPRSCQSLADVLRCRRSSPRINAW